MGATAAVRGMLARIEERAARVGPVKLMEVCGTHTTAIQRAGLRGILPASVRLVSGPGCPVCVTPHRYMDTAVALARRPEVTILTFGDLVRVPGSTSTLEDERVAGADVRVVLSPLDALRFVEERPDRIGVFLAVGFETTAPTVAATLVEARRRGLDRLLVLVAHKVMPPAMRALADDPDMRIDGFLCPGHVCVVAGVEPFRFLAEDMGKACVVSGFEPEDLLLSILMLLEQIDEERPAVEIQYRRAVRPAGNPRARAVVDEVFEPADAEWRGLGTLAASGLGLREAYVEHDAIRRIPVDVEPTVVPPGCRCGDVLKGRIEPEECGLFGRTCTPDRPVGACMVSVEGACRARHRYGSSHR